MRVMRWDWASSSTMHAFCKCYVRSDRRCVEVDHDRLLIVRVLVKVPLVVLRQRPAPCDARNGNISPNALNLSARARRAGSMASAAAVLAKNVRNVSTRKLSRDTMSTKKSGGVSFSWKCSATAA